MNRFIGAFATTALLIGCGAPEPNIVVTTTPSRGVAPVAIEFDATGSTDPDDPRASLTARFDFDGNGTFETDASSEMRASFVYEQPGTYKPIVEVRSGERVGTSRLTLEILPNTPPTAAISVTPPAGRAPLAVTLDASASTDPDQDAATLEARFDFESDGVFDTEFGALTMSYAFQRSGEHRVTVELRDHGGATGTATSEPVVVEAGADLDVDTNRDGLIDDTDDENEDAWTAESGAVFIANLDDDNLDGARDADAPTLEGGEDLKDFASAIVHQNADLTAQDRVTVTVTPPAAANAVRIYSVDSNGTIAVLHSPGNSTANAIAPAALAAGDVQLLIEGTSTRTTAWDGNVTLTLSITAGGETLTDAVALRISPVIFTDNLQPAQRLYVMRINDRRLGPNLEFYDVLQADIPASVELYTADQYDYLGDRWLQDNMQTGYQSMPTAEGTLVMQTHLQTQRPTGNQGLEPFLLQELLGANRGWAYPGRSRNTSLNYGGNLEVVPPHDGYPLGRVIVGGGSGGTLDGRAYSDTMSEGQLAWLDAQGIQGPTIEVHSEWLAVGHIDEIFLFVPNKNAAVGERPFKALFASPSLALEILETVEANGGSNLQVFAGRATQTTVGAILRNNRLLSYQDAAQTKIDTVREQVMTAVGLTEADILEVPVLYEWHAFDGLEFAAAYNPGIQNLIVLDEHLFVPDPEGPVVGGEDVFRTATRAVLEPLGLTPQFVDIFDSYHLNLGEAHCGTEVEGAAYETPWWTK